MLLITVLRGCKGMVGHAFGPFIGRQRGGVIPPPASEMLRICPQRRHETHGPPKATRAKVLFV